MIERTGHVLARTAPRDEGRPEEGVVTASGEHGPGTVLHPALRTESVRGTDGDADASQGRIHRNGVSLGVLGPGPMAFDASTQSFCRKFLEQ